MKSAYRRGLGARYGRLMQAISGVHFNYSFPAKFWPLWAQQLGARRHDAAFTTACYFDLVRNYRRFGWLALYLFGTEAIHGFSFAMLFGIAIGTYSSIFVAAPFLLLFGVKREWSGPAAKPPTAADAPGKARRENVASK